MMSAKLTTETQVPSQGFSTACQLHHNNQQRTEVTFQTTGQKLPIEVFILYIGGATGKVGFPRKNHGEQERKG